MRPKLWAALLIVTSIAPCAIAQEVGEVWARIGIGDTVYPSGVPAILETGGWPAWEAQTTPQVSKFWDGYQGERRTIIRNPFGVWIDQPKEPMLLGAFRKAQQKGLRQVVGDPTIQGDMAQRRNEFTNAMESLKVQAGELWFYMGTVSDARTPSWPPKDPYWYGDGDGISASLMTSRIMDSLRWQLDVGANIALDASADVGPRHPLWIAATLVAHGGGKVGYEGHAKAGQLWQDQADWVCFVTEQQRKMLDQNQANWPGWAETMDNIEGRYVVLCTTPEYAISCLKRGWDVEFGVWSAPGWTAKKLVDAATTPVPPVPPDPPDTGQTTNVVRNNNGGFKLASGGPYFIVNEQINAIEAVLIDNGINVTALELDSVAATSERYGIYAGTGQSNQTTIVDSMFVATGPGDNYCLRGFFKNLVIRDSSFVNAAGTRMCLRLYNVASCTMEGAITRGGPILLGGGPADQNVDILPFENFTFTGCTFQLDTQGSHLGLMVFMPKTRNGVIENTHFITPYIDKALVFRENANNITIKNCTIRKTTDPPDAWQPVKWSHVSGGKPPDADARKLKIEP